MDNPAPLEPANRNRMKGWVRRCRKWLRWPIAGLFILGLAGLWAVRHPAPFFTYAVEEDGLVLRSDRPFDPEAGRRVLRAVRSTLGHPFSEGRTMRAQICIANSPWRRTLFFLPDRRAVGISYPVTPHVFLSGARVERNTVIAPNGEEALSYFSLEHTAAHELGHVLSYGRLGAWKVLRGVPEWIREGLAEAATQSGDQEEEARLFLEGQPEMAPLRPGTPPYRRYRFLVNALLARGWSLERLVDSGLNQLEAEALVRIGV